jgi:hypothetical protein
VSIYDALNRATWLQLTLENVKRAQVTFRGRREEGEGEKEREGGAGCNWRK